MSDQRPNPSVIRETTVRESSGNGSILFILGAVVVALGVLAWYVMGGGAMSTAPAVTKTNVTIEAPAAPAAQAPAAAAPADPAPAAPAAPAPAAPAAPAP